MGLCDVADICARMDAHEGQAAWAQAFGAVLALVIAIALPRLDRWRAKREYGEAAVAAADFAHMQIAAVWIIAHGLAGQPARTEDFVAELDRAGRDLEGFPLLGTQSVQAVVYMRQLAACCRGMAEIARELGGEQRERSHGVANYAHHLLVLIARELSQPESPPPFSTDGVPPEIVEALGRPRVGRFRLGR